MSKQRSKTKAFFILFLSMIILISSSMSVLAHEDDGHTEAIANLKKDIVFTLSEDGKSMTVKTKTQLKNVVIKKKADIYYKQEEINPGESEFELLNRFSDEDMFGLIATYEIEGIPTYTDVSRGEPSKTTNNSRVGDGTVSLTVKRFLNKEEFFDYHIFVDGKEEHLIGETKDLYRVVSSLIPKSTNLQKVFKEGSEIKVIVDKKDAEYPYEMEMLLETIDDKGNLGWKKIEPNDDGEYLTSISGNTLLVFQEKDFDKRYEEYMKLREDGKSINPHTMKEKEEEVVNIDENKPTETPKPVEKVDNSTSLLTILIVGAMVIILGSGAMYVIFKIAEAKKESDV